MASSTWDSARLLKVVKSIRSSDCWSLLVFTSFEIANAGDELLRAPSTRRRGTTVSFKDATALLISSIDIAFRLFTDVV